MKNRWCAYIAGSLLFLILGLLPYILVRQEVMFLQPIRNILPEPLSPNKTVIYRLFINHFSDFAWYVALLLFMESFTYHNKTDRMLYIAAIVMPFVLEAGQAFHIISGTFDWLDMLTYTLTITIYLTMQKISKNKKTLLQCTALVAFAGMALACSSFTEKDRQDLINVHRYVSGELSLTEPSSNIYAPQDSVSINYID